MIMLRLERVSKYYFTGNNVIQALRRVSLEFGIGEFVAITGESGSGKSTLLNVLSGLDTYEEGKVFYNGQDFSNYTIEELEHYRKDYIGYLFQEYNIINSYTVYQNIELALVIQGYDKTKIREKVLELIKTVNLEHVTYQKAGNLSGGEKQRTVIARTLAKDCPILVCDEPTESLNQEASEEIFKLLRKISKEKLVIVVTHDISEIQKYATRKIRLYDGEIMEDAILVETPDKTDSMIEANKSKTTWLGTVQIALQNILTVPRKSLFALLSLIFILATVVFVYSVRIVEINQPYSVSNSNFSNTDPSRIVLVKDDKSQFTDAEIEELGNVKGVLGVFGNDIVFDSTFTTKIYDEETSEYTYLDYQPLSSLILSEDDLLDGSRLPTNDHEVVLKDNGWFAIGDEIDLANTHLLFKSDSLDTDQFTFTVVGLTKETESSSSSLHTIYLPNPGLERMASSSIFEQSEVWIDISGTEVYYMLTDTWITPDMDPEVDTGNRQYMLSYPIWIQIDSTLADDEILTFDMMYFDICRDFGYKKEISDDFEAGLCEVPDFLDSHEIKFKAITEFENLKPFGEITVVSSTYTDTDHSLKLYMNSTTYNRYFGESNYQITVIVKDLFDGNDVFDDLIDLGYNPFYPAQILSSSISSSIVFENILITIITLIVIFAIFFIGYFILNNIIFSKLKDYLIIRSIGASKSALKRILWFEIFILVLFAVSIIFLVIVIVNRYIYELPDIFRFYLWTDDLLLIGLTLAVIEIMVARFTKKIFKASVITTLKGVE